MIFIMVLNIFLIFYATPRWGQINPVIPITVTASLGAVTVASAKGVGLALKNTLNGNSQFGYWFTWVVLAILPLCIIIQLIFLDRAIAAFNANIVCPILYVEFNMFTLSGSAILYNEFDTISVKSICTMFIGFIINFVSVFLVSSFKNLDFGWRSYIYFVFESGTCK